MTADIVSRLRDLLPGLCVLALVLVVVIVGHDTYQLTLRRVTVHHPDLPPEFDGFTVLQITDVHGQRFGPRQERVFDLLRHERFDLAALTGDYVTYSYSVQELQATLDIITGLRAAHPDVPIYYVHGNHDRHEPAEMDILLQHAGAVSLEPPARPVRLTRGDAHIWLARAAYPETMLQEHPVPPEDFCLVLAHVPRHFEVDRTQERADRERRIALEANPGLDLPRQVWPESDVVLAGHMHGGQICLPGIGALYAPGRRIDGGGFFPRYSKGIYTDGDRTLHISGGLGSTGFLRTMRFRLFNPPEINLIRLSRGTSRPSSQPE